MVDQFLGRAGPAVREALGGEAALPHILETLVERGRRAWPELPLDPAEFVGHLAEKLPGDASASKLTSVHAEDLWLACACFRELPGAREALEARYFAEVDAAASRLRGKVNADEIRQQVRVVLFFGRDGQRARIGDYSGRGDLRHWIRAAAARTALNAVPARQQTFLEDDEIARLPMPSDSPEIEVMKTRYGAEFKQALRDAMGRLSPEHQNMLRLFYLDDLTCAQIGKLHQTSAATVSRRMAEARSHLLDDVRKVLMDRLSVGRDEVNSILRFIGSRMELSRSALRPPE